MSKNVHVIHTEANYCFAVLDSLGSGQLLVFLWQHDYLTEMWAAKMLLYPRGLGNPRILMFVSNEGLEEQQP